MITVTEVVVFLLREVGAVVVTISVTLTLTVSVSVTVVG